MDRFEFERQLASAAREMAAEKGMAGTLDRAVLMATDLVEQCRMAGVSVVLDGSVETLSATSEELRKVDAMQHMLGEGPYLDALRQEDIVISVDLGEDSRWPQWGSQVVEQTGMQSVLLCRLFTTGKNLGALTLYSDGCDAFTHEDILDALTLAAHAAVALSDSLRAKHLGLAVQARTITGQATGILMERFGLDADRAFEVMRRMSNQTNRKISQIALELVETGSSAGVPTGEPRPPQPV